MSSIKVSIDLSRMCTRFGYECTYLSSGLPSPPAGLEDFAGKFFRHIEGRAFKRRNQAAPSEFVDSDVAISLATGTSKL